MRDLAYPVNNSLDAGTVGLLRAEDGAIRIRAWLLVSIRGGLKLWAHRHGRVAWALLVL